MGLHNILKFFRDRARDIKNRVGLKTTVLAAQRRGDILKRIKEFDVLFDRCKNASILDIGCHDGLIAYELYRRGAVRILGIDNDAYHLDTASRIFSQTTIPTNFVHVDLRKPKALQATIKMDNFTEFDIVLFLGVFQHIYKQMAPKERQFLVDVITQSTKSLLAIRLPDHVWQIFETHFPIQEFELLQKTKHEGTVGELRIYERI